MANNEHAQGRCPSCGGNEIEADKRYGNKLKGREFMRQCFRSPLIWIGFALLLLGAYIPVLNATGQIEWRYGLVALGLVLIGITARSVGNRAVFGPSATTQFPEVGYTCRLCRHQWTSEEPQTTLAHETGDKETTGSIEPQQAKTDFRIEGKAKSQTSKRSAAISIFLAICLNGLFVLLIKAATSADLLLCLPLSAAIIGLGAGAGALLAKIFGGNPWKGVTIGIWIGAVASIAVLIAGVFAAGT